MTVHFTDSATCKITHTAKHAGPAVDASSIGAIGTSSPRSRKCSPAGIVPLPDTLAPQDSGKADPDVLDVSFGGCRFRRLPQSSPPQYELTLHGTTNKRPVDGSSETTVELTLCIESPRGACLHSNEGVVSIGPWHHDMFYYFSPLCTLVTSGDRKNSLCINARDVDLRSTTAASFWIDHEFGGVCPNDAAEMSRLADLSRGNAMLEQSWEWLALHCVERLTR